MADKRINIQLGSRFNGSGFSAAMKSIRNLTRGAANIKAAFDMGLGAVSKAFGAFKSIIGSAFKFETQTTQFKTLIGNIDEAKAHMADLKALGETPPFSLDQFVAASRSLMVMTDGALGYKKSLEMIGDAAAATGKPVEEMGQAVGRLFAVIRDGQPLSRATMQLRNMGVITPEVAAKLDEMQKAGKSATEIWTEFEKALSKYNGAMKETEQTGDGLMGAIKSRWESIVRSFGDAMSDTAKDGLGAVLDKIKELEEGGDLEVWARKAVDAFHEVANGARALWTPLSKVVGVVWGAVKGQYQSTASGIGSAVGTLVGGGGIREAFKRGWKGYKQGWIDAFDLDGAQAADDEAARGEIRQRNAAKKAKVEAEAAKRAADEEKRIHEALAEGDRKLAEKAAAEKEKAEIEAAKKAAAERERLDRELHQKRMADLRAEIAAQNEAANNLKARAAAAQSEFDRAFALFRSPDAAANQRAEEESYRADLNRLHKSARRYGGQWRIDELSALMAAGDTQGVSDTLAGWRRSRSFTPEVEAMVRASAAERTKTTTEDELRKIENNTAQLATKLDELLQVKGGANG